MKIALPFPRNQGDAPEQPPAVRRRFAGWHVVVILIGLGLIVGGSWQLWRTQLAPSGAAPPAAVPVTVGDLAIDIESSGAVKPAKGLELPFQIGGKVQEVLVKPGDSVAVGQPLARLDDRELRLGVQQAEAGLKIAQAKLAKAHNGDATPQDMALAQSNLKAAEAQLQKTRTGNITSADLREAAAALCAAQARLDALQNPS